MNSHSPFTYLLAGLVALLQPFTALSQAPSDSAGKPFEIRSVKRTTKRVAYVDGGWKNNWACIEADLRVSGDLKDSKPYAKAYFFDKDNKLVTSFDKPPQTSEDHSTYSGLPSLFKQRQPNEVSFPISEKATQAGSKWARVIVVFGDATSAVAEVYPKDDLAKFEFPEKGLVTQGLKTPAR